MTITNEQIAEIRALLEKATPDWHLKSEFGDTVFGGDGYIVTDCIDGHTHDHAQLIVTLRNLAPAMLDELERLRKVATEAKEARDILAKLGADRIFSPMARDSFKAISDNLRAALSESEKGTTK